MQEQLPSRSTQRFESAQSGTKSCYALWVQARLFKLLFIRPLTFHEN